MHAKPAGRATGARPLELCIYRHMEGSAGNMERMAFLYDTRKVTFGGLASEIVLPPMKVKDEDGKTQKQAITWWQGHHLWWDLTRYLFYPCIGPYSLWLFQS
ncbi:MAG: hypothetical protein R3B93_13535 [Bacteroidia bacterium]